MNVPDQQRRLVLRGSTLALAAAVPVKKSLAQTSTLFKRLEWQSFKNTSHYGALVAAIRSMKNNTNAADPRSWAYWTNVHINYCPHSVPYFFAWHRGYLYYFEEQLRAVSGDAGLILPYWDYYSYPTMPSEFTNASSTNPLYVSRVNTNVRQALTMAPFSPTLTNFPRGWRNAFEPSFEGMPHNPVHDIIGNVMSTMKSPIDPIFWLHHANVDRLWVAWAGAGGGRVMPARSDSYWSGRFNYSSTLSMGRFNAYDTRSTMGYTYQNETMPGGLPALAQAPRLRRIQATRPFEGGRIPPAGNFKLLDPHAIGDTGFAVTGAAKVALDERSVSVTLPVNAEHAQALVQVGQGKRAQLRGDSKAYRSVHLVLDGIELSQQGENGGFFYKVYVNLPRPDDNGAAPTQELVGTLGAFQVNGARHHHGGPARLRFALSHVFAGLSSSQIGLLSISFERVDGDNTPAGPVIGIDESRIELSTDAPEQ